MFNMLSKAIYFVTSIFIFLSFYSFPAYGSDKSIISINSHIMANNETLVVIVSNYDLYPQLVLDKEPEKFTIKCAYWNKPITTKDIQLSGIIKNLDIKSGILTFYTYDEFLVKDIKTVKLANNLWQSSFSIEDPNRKSSFYNILTSEAIYNHIATQKNKGHKFTVVIDPGHGGIDSGAIAPDGTMEKNITLKFAKRLKQKMLKNPNIAVYLTRDTDRYLYLSERVEKAREL